MPRMHCRFRDWPQLCLERVRAVKILCYAFRGEAHVYFFFSSRRRHTRLQGDWSSDVCSSDLGQFEFCVQVKLVRLRGVRVFDLRAEAFRQFFVDDSQFRQQVHRKPPNNSAARDRKSTRLSSSHLVISYAVFCLKKKNRPYITSGASIPNKSSTRTSCASTNPHNARKNARFCASSSDKIWCL